MDHLTITLLEKMFRETTPEEMLRRQFVGKEVSVWEMEVIKPLQNKGLSDSVINVLLQYVAELHGKLERQHVLEVGASWAKQKVQTTKKAMCLVDDQIKHKYLQIYGVES
ncbi:DnaD domain protein [Bacillus sp. V5-8f]|uniref:DnaD domain protein n=1 Tax=Bacillus sp. V5-8f TaxID=2053044 RepID=UPI000C764605|nr:DnaD domain protein [Bacillus sp. V5-8f]PLT35785.1 hypothetical protein CUU64_00475 [Bacillus sp. V5-8f]